MQIQFHCKEDSNFRFKDENVCGFLYTDYVISPHSHKFYEMNIILSGEGTHHIENASVRVGVGDVFVIPPGMVHAYGDCEKLDVFHILLKKDFINRNKEETDKVDGFVQLMEIEPFLRSSSSSELFLHLSPKQLIKIRKELDELEEIYHCRNEKFEPLSSHIAWKIIYMLSEIMYKQIHSEHSENNKNEKSVIEVIEYIHLHYGEKITLTRLCNEFFLSRSTLLRNFEKVCHCSPAEYLQEYRRKKAEELMAKGELSKTEIAQACGFYDLAHMKKVIEKGM